MSNIIIDRTTDEQVIEIGRQVQAKKEIQALFKEALKRAMEEETQGLVNRGMKGNILLALQTLRVNGYSHADITRAMQ